MHYIDPTGELGCIGGTIGFVVGAAGGAATAIASGGDAATIVTSVFVGGAVGIVTETINPGALFFSGPTAAAITGGIIGFGGSVASQVVQNRLDPNLDANDFSLPSAMARGIVGAASMPLGPVLGSCLVAAGNSSFEYLKPRVNGTFLSPPGASVSPLVLDGWPRDSCERCNE